MGAEGQAVRFRDCSCPGTPHTGKDGADDGDIVIMRDHLGFVAGAEVARAMGEAMRHVDLSGWIPDPKSPVPAYIQNQINGLSFEYLAPIYLREGPLSWNLLDEHGPVEMTKEALLGLSYSEGLPIGQKGDELYSDEVASPLVKRTNALAGNGRIDGKSRSTRPTIRSSSPHRSSRKQSSPNGSGGKPSPVNP